MSSTFLIIIFFQYLENSGYIGSFRDAKILRLWSNRSLFLPSQSAFTLLINPSEKILNFLAIDIQNIPRKNAAIARKAMNKFMVVRAVV